MYLPLDINVNDYEREVSQLELRNDEKPKENKNDVAKKLRMLLEEAGIPSIDENLLLKGLLSSNAALQPDTDTNANLKPQPVDLIQSENDFIDAYNALTRSSPLPNINNDNINKTNKTDNKSYTTNEEQIYNNTKASNINTSENHVKVQDTTSTKTKLIQNNLNNKQQIDNSLINSNNGITQPTILDEAHTEQLKINDNNNIPQPIVTKEERLDHSANNLTDNTSQQVTLSQEHVQQEEIINSTNGDRQDITMREENKQQSTDILSNNTTQQIVSHANHVDVSIDINQHTTKETMLQTDKNSSKSGKNEHSSEKESQRDEKSKNLSDMVDNTQKLIQQMKEEINSDINSIDGRTVSQSEIETSSEETNDEQESSYTDTEEGTDNLTSDEKEITSSEEEGSEEEQFDEQQEMQYRASSEDNEHFEEALDHVENQLEDFKNANIEMLDSIARTLQEEHVFTVESNKLKTENTSTRPKKQDINNNVFVPVNSFEEIYEELNSKNHEMNSILEVPQNLKPVAEPKFLNLPAKETIIYDIMETVTPSKLVISENKINVLKADLEIIEEKETDSGGIVNIQPTLVAIPENTAKEKDARNGDQLIINGMLQETEGNVTHINDTTDNTVATVNINLDSMPSIKHTGVDSASDASTSEPSVSVPVTEPDNSGQYASSEVKEQETIEDANEEGVQNTKTNETLVKDQSPIPSNQTSKTPDNVVGDKVNENSNGKSSVPNKSNIPKLIKVIPNNKTKLDKNSPKVIVSKVPIRRTSIKQYPAPAPPKSHFGNVQSGHVKQLQTKLFNKETTSTPVPVTSETIEVKPSTSTLNKKKQAPLPPTKPEEKQPSPPKTSTPPKGKKQYFRETCRTEDEWTDSESDDSQIQVIRPSEESKHSPPSPPPPLTLRRVSGHLIDLAKIRLPDGSPEVRISKLFNL